LGANPASFYMKANAKANFGVKAKANTKAKASGSIRKQQKGGRPGMQS